MLNAEQQRRLALLRLLAKARIQWHMLLDKDRRLEDRNNQELIRFIKAS